MNPLGLGLIPYSGLDVQCNIKTTQCDGFPRTVINGNGVVVNNQFYSGWLMTELVSFHVH